VQRIISCFIENNKSFEISQQVSTQGVDFINILRGQFSYEILAPKISTQSTAYIQNFGDKNLLTYEKCARKTLMKLMEGCIRMSPNVNPFLSVREVSRIQHSFEWTIHFSVSVFVYFVFYAYTLELSPSLFIPPRKKNIS